MEKTREQIAAEIAARCEALGTRTPSGLPADATLPPDAQALRAENKTPLEFALEVMNDECMDLKTRLDAAKMAMSYMHRAPVAKQEIQISNDAMGEALFRHAADRSLVSDDELRAALAAAEARLAKSH